MLKRFMERKEDEDGFTLIELMVVVSDHRHPDRHRPADVPGCTHPGPEPRRAVRPSQRPRGREDDVHGQQLVRGRRRSDRLITVEPSLTYTAAAATGTLSSLPRSQRHVVQPAVCRFEHAASTSRTVRPRVTAVGGRTLSASASASTSRTTAAARDEVRQAALPERARLRPGPRGRRELDLSRHRSWQEGRPDRAASLRVARLIDRVQPVLRASAATYPKVNDDRRRLILLKRKRSRCRGRLQWVRQKARPMTEARS